MTIGRLVRRSSTARALVAAVPSVVLLYAYASGPEARKTGAPGDDPLSCTTAGCHQGTPLNGGSGNVTVRFAGSQTYTPGVQQTFTIAITDPQARVYGFQMTARLESDLSKGQAGDFAAGAQQIVLCDDNTNLRTATRPCPANFPVQFIEHSEPFRTNTIAVSWTPPATNAGNIRLYVAANAANGDGNNTGDRIYTANYLLTPQVSASPSIASVISAAAFNQNAGLASGTWMELYGSNLSDTTRSWAGGDFNGLLAPASLDGVKVTVNGVPAYIAYVSPGQVNFQAPEDAARGNVEIQLTNGSAKSNVITLSKAALAPALLAPPSFMVGGQQYVVAQFLDQTFVGRNGLIAGVNFRPAKPGDAITIYGIGFGPVTPSTPAGTVALGTTSLVNPATFKLGGVPVVLTYSGLAPNAVGLYQFNLTVPNVAAGDQPLTVDIGGITLDQKLVLTVGQ
jgi:uncharacterized protein (TIGR03437 family)